MNKKEDNVGIISRLLSFGRLGWGTSLLFLMLVALAACSSIDCPLNNRVYTKYALRTPEGKADTLKLSMTISTNRTDGSDSVLINKDENVTSFSLPISNAQPRDSFFVELTGETMNSIDTVVVSKNDKMHFESTDCTPSYFHTLTGVATTHHAVDSIVINNNNVDYDSSKTHFYIYFAPRN